LPVLLAALCLACSPEGLPEGNKAPLEAETPADRAPQDEPRPETPIPSNAEHPARGLWVLAEGSVRVLDDPSRIPALLDRAARLEATDLFVQVYRGGRVFFPADETFPIDGPVEIAGVGGAERTSDTFRLLLEAAHGQGLRIHGWVNVLSLSTRREARVIEELGRSAILVDRQGRSVLDYPDLDVPAPDRRYYRMGTRGVYLDPGDLEVREYLVTLFRDLVTRYPTLDGLHLDYIRHPGVLPFVPGSRFGVGLDFGYGEQSRARYRAETGNPDPIEGVPPGTVRGANDWDDWRRNQVTELVEEISVATRQARPGIVLSAAVIPYVDRAYLTLAQDWRGWLESGAIDLAMPMTYTLDDRLLRYQLESFAGWPLAARIWPGLGVWLFEARPARALAQLELLRTLGFTGELYFSDDAIAESPRLLEALSIEATSRDAEGAESS
jgi:uncharacterized lipoprotein YddW (UPF0748 family)